MIQVFYRWRQCYYVITSKFFFFYFIKSEITVLRILQIIFKSEGKHPYTLHKRTLILTYIKIKKIFVQTAHSFSFLFPFFAQR